MEQLLSASFWLQLADSVGVPAVFALILLILRKSDERRMDQIDKVREADRCEHVKKWDSMIDQHKDERDRHKEELDRLLRLYERQASANELQANCLIHLTEKVDSNQYCPVIRQKGILHE